MKPKTLKTWEFVKNKRHDISQLIRHQQGPEEFYYQFDGYIYSPAVRVIDMDMIPENYKK